VRGLGVHGEKGWYKDKGVCGVAYLGSHGCGGVERRRVVLECPCVRKKGEGGDEGERFLVMVTTQTRRRIGRGQLMQRACACLCLCGCLDLFCEKQNGHGLIHQGEKKENLTSRAMIDSKE